MAGKDQPHQLLWTNTKMLTHYFALTGHHLPWGFGSQATISDSPSLCPPFPSPILFSFETYTGCCEIHYTSTLLPPAHHVAIYSDNSNTVESFNTMKTHEKYDILLKFVVDILI
jgi:hypothetical protein